MAVTWFHPKKCLIFTWFPSDRRLKEVGRPWSVENSLLLVENEDAEAAGPMKRQNPIVLSLCQKARGEKGVSNGPLEWSSLLQNKKKKTALSRIPYRCHLHAFSLVYHALLVNICIYIYIYIIEGQSDPLRQMRNGVTNGLLVTLQIPYIYIKWYILYRKQSSIIVDIFHLRGTSTPIF